MLKACPGCEGELDVTPANPGVFVCGSCDGRFIVRAALEQFNVTVPHHIARKMPRRPRTCAGCQSSMDTIQLEGVTLDFCADCGALYFDAGELDQVRRERPQEGPPPDARPIECDGCGELKQISQLRSRDGKALCKACWNDDPHQEGAALNERDFRRAARHASYQRVEDNTPGRHQNYGIDEDAGTAATALIDVLARIFS